MHIALRAPRDKSFFVDGEDVVPGVHAVLDKVKNDDREVIIVRYS